jgi:hypothetical protein
MSDGIREARTAACWWVDQLTGDESIRTGDAMNEAFAMYARSKQTPPKADQVEAFRAHLEQGIIAMLRDPINSWEKAVAEGPQWGSYFRTIAVDYGPDKVLGDALKAAGLPSGAELLLPLKTVMWVNPGVVKVSAGYGSGEEELDLVDE